MFIKLIRATLLILTILLTEGCSAFVIKHVDASGKSQTYITNTVFVGTGTFLDCFISPFHWFAGIFYKQPYVHVQGGNLSYPSFSFDENDFGGTFGPYSHNLSSNICKIYNAIPCIPTAKSHANAPTAMIY